MRNASYIVFVLTFIGIVPANAQNDVRTPQSQSERKTSPTDLYWISTMHRDPGAVAVAENAIRELGGTEAVSRLKSMSARGTDQPVAGSANQLHIFHWTVDGNESRLDIESSLGKRSLVSGSGKPFIETDGSRHAIAIHRIQASFFPPFVCRILWRELNDPHYSFELVNPEATDTSQALVIRTHDTSSRTSALATPQTWYFDAKTFLPIRVIYRVPDIRDVRHSVSATVDLSDFQVKDGILYPAHFFRSISETSGQDVKVTEVQVNLTLSTQTFANPEGAAK